MPNELTLEIFRAGDYGPKGVYSVEDLDAIVASYNPDVHMAPVTTDHEWWGPAFGWVESVMRSGNTLLAKLVDIPNDFFEALKEKRWRNRSVELWPADVFVEGTEQKIKGPYLRAVTFLGAAAPHVKGLKPAFSEGTPDQFEKINFSEEETAAGDTPSVSETDNAPEGGEGAEPQPGSGSESDNTTPSHNGTKPDGADPLNPDGGSPPPNNPTAAATAEEDKTMATIEELQTQLSEEKAARETAEKSLEAAKAEAAAAKQEAQGFSEQMKQQSGRIAELERKTADADFNEKFAALAKQGKVTKAERELLRYQFHAARKAESAGAEAVKFGEKDLKPVDLFWEGLEARPQIVPLGESASAEGAERDTAHFAADPDAKLNKAVEKFREETVKATGKGLTFAEAYDLFAAEKPEEFRKLNQARYEQPAAV